jgi:outer membrane protein assembly factor BamD
MKKISLIVIIISLIVSCGSKSDVVNENISERFNLGVKYFEKEKYLKAEMEFNYLILNNPGSKLALDAQYYLAESMFYQKKYDESIVEYDRYSRFSDDFEKIESAEFKSCEASFILSNDYLHDQGAAAELMDKLQVFVEKYPVSSFIKDIESFFIDIRSRLAKKEYEAGRLYLKLEEYDSARIYFNEVISLYYDTIYSDKARVEIIFSFLLQENPTEAKTHLNLYKGKFIEEDRFNIAQNLINDLEEGNLTLSNYYRLYK